MPQTAKIRRLWKALPVLRVGGSQKVLTRMSVLLVVAGALAAMVGVGMVGYGIPINEFSFGNTLIVSGTTAVIGGLIVIAIGVAVGKLQRIAEYVGFPRAGAGRPSTCSSRRLARARRRCRAACRSRSGRNPRRPSRKRSRTTNPPPKNNRWPRRCCAIRRGRTPPANNYEVEEYEAVSLSPQQPPPRRGRAGRAGAGRPRSATMPCRSPACARRRT